MVRSHLIFLLIAGSVGCAETQSERAFLPRRAAEEVPVSTTPNRVGDHDRALAEAIDRSLVALEDEPMLPVRPGEMDTKESSATRDVHASEGARASKTSGATP
jgi:hypothetical protein